MGDGNDMLSAATAGNQGTLMDKLGLEYLEVSPDRVVARMPVAGNTQPFGLLHGGASAALAETVGSLGASLSGVQAAGIELNATHHRPVRSGWVTATGVPLYEGRTVATWEIVITDDRGRRVCTARLTCALLS